MTAEPQPHRPDHATVWRHELQAWAQVSGETMRVWIRNGRLPKPSIVISRNRQGWAAGELRRHGVEVA